MKSIYLIRHAQSTGNLEKRLTGETDYPLTAEGRRQVDSLTEYLQEINYELIYSSPSQRAIDTVKPLAQLKNKVVNIDKRLREMYFGIYDGFTWDKVNSIDISIHKNHILTNQIMGIPKQESTEDVANRMYESILEISKNHIEKNILIASHGVAIEAFLRRITGVPFEKQRELYSQKNTAINKILFDNGKFYVAEINILEHLKHK